MRLALDITSARNVHYWPIRIIRYPVAYVRFESQADPRQESPERQLWGLNRTFAEVSLFQKPKPFPEPPEAP